MDRKILIIVLISLFFYISNLYALKNIKKVKSPFRDECGKQFPLTMSRIFGGKDAELGEYPWLVRILHSSKNGLIAGCTGFIIHRKFILTAAHCAAKSIQDYLGPIYQVVLGEHNTTSVKDCKIIMKRREVCADLAVYANVLPKKTIVHNKYQDSPLNRDHYYDIALLQLKKPIKYTKFIQPICLAEETTEAEHFYISGWGRTNKTGSSDVKLKANIPRADQDECMDKYETKDININYSQICAGGVSGIDTCSGDSGGPLMAEKNFTWYAEGIVSFGKECGLQGWPGIYTNIPHYIDWIKTKIMNRLKTDRKIAKIVKDILYN